MKRLIVFLATLFVMGQVLADERGAVVIAEVRNARVVYEAEGKQSDLDGVIALLRARAEKTSIPPQKDTAVILASKDLTINQIQALHSTLAAYGFLDIRVLAFTSDKTRLQELSFGSKPIRFTKDRHELLSALGNK